MNELVRRVAAACVMTVLLVAVACDLWIGGFRNWWERHALTASIVSNLLVLAVAGLVVDEVVARRQRRARAVSVAVQGLIVYGQAERTYKVVTESDAENLRSGNAREELRTLASMLLTASPSLFDDPEARRFLEQLERFSASLFRSLRDHSEPVVNGPSRNQLASEMTKLKATVETLAARIPTDDREVLEGSPGA